MGNFYIFFFDHPLLWETFSRKPINKNHAALENVIQPAIQGEPSQAL
jgi:hypothetical protein